MIEFLRLPSTWLLLAVALVTGALVHVGLVLALPTVSDNPGMERIVRIAPVNEMMVLPAAAPGEQMLPFMAPDVRYALCHFDIAAGPLSLRAQLLSEVWTIAIFDREGRNVFTIAGSDIRRRDVEIVLASAAEELAAAVPVTQQSAPSAGTINATIAGTEGVAMLLAPELGPSYRRETEQALRQASCAVRDPTGGSEP